MYNIEGEAGMCDTDIVGNYYLVTCRLDNIEWGAWPRVGGVVMNEAVVVMRI